MSVARGTLKTPGNLQTSNFLANFLPRACRKDELVDVGASMCVDELVRTVQRRCTTWVLFMECVAAHKSAVT